MEGDEPSRQLPAESEAGRPVQGRFGVMSVSLADRKLT